MPLLMPSQPPQSTESRRSQSRSTPPLDLGARSRALRASDYYAQQTPGGLEGTPHADPGGTPQPKSETMRRVFQQGSAPLQPEPQAPPPSWAHITPGVSLLSDEASVTLSAIGSPASAAGTSDPVTPATAPLPGTHVNSSRAAAASERQQHWTGSASAGGHGGSSYSSPWGQAPPQVFSSLASAIKGAQDTATKVMPGVRLPHAPGKSYPKWFPLARLTVLDLPTGGAPPAADRAHP